MTMVNGSHVIDLHKQRFELRDKQGFVIADGGVIIGAGVYNDDQDHPHVCIHVQDPHRNDGIRHIYVLQPDAAQQIAGGLLGAYERVKAK